MYWARMRIDHILFIYRSLNNVFRTVGAMDSKSHWALSARGRVRSVSRGTAAPPRSAYLSLLSPRMTKAGSAVRITHVRRMRHTWGGEAGCSRAALARHLPADQMYNAPRLSSLSPHRVVVIRRACPCVALPRAIRSYANCGGAVLPQDAVIRGVCVMLRLRGAALWRCVYIMLAWRGTWCNHATQIYQLLGFRI